MAEEVDYINEAINNCIELAKNTKRDFIDAALRATAAYKNSDKDMPQAMADWRAVIQVRGKQICLGCHLTKEAAWAVRRTAEMQYRGTFAPAEDL